MRLFEIGEEALIARIVERLPASVPGLVEGAGDDAAVLAPDGSGSLVLVTTDMLSEGVDYLPDQITPFQLGWKSAAASLSDIAAMGGLPTWTFASLGFRPETDVEYVDEVYRGLVECTQRFGSALAGGDTNSVRGDAVISITQLGKVEPERLARRVGAREGDRIVVTGHPGDALGGFLLLSSLGLDGALEASEYLVNAHFMPMPRVPEARAAVSTGFVRAMMDLSDGLGADLPKLCRASGLGAVLRAGALPVSEELRRCAGRLGADALELAATGGEDFELLMAVAPEGVEEVIRAIEAATGTGAADIGEFREGPVLVELQDGELRPAGGGWEHFSGGGR